MVVIRGQPRRAAFVACGNGVLILLAIGVIVLVLYRAPAKTQLSAQVSGIPVELRLLITLSIVVPIAIIFLLSFLASILAALRFARLSAHVIMTHDGLRFPAIPGFRWSKRIAWSDIHSVSALGEDSYPKAYDAFFKVSNWSFGHPVLLRIDLRRWNKRAGLRGLKDWLERLIQSTMVGPNALLEAVFADGLSPEQTEAAVSAMFQDTAIRAKYGGDGTTYVVRPGPGNDVRFELV